MKKVNRTTNILFLVAIAFFIKSFLDKNATLAFVGLLVSALASFRFMLIRQASQMDMDDSATLDHIMRYLNKNETRYAQMIVAYQKGSCEVLYEENDGILLYDNSTQTYLASANTEAGAKDILYLLPQDYGLLITHDEVFKQFEKQLFDYVEHLQFYHFQYTQKGKYKLPQSNLRFQMLSVEDVEIVKQHYKVKDLCNDQYITRCIEAGMMAAYSDDVMVGFIGTHESGAMGMLEVFEEYQGKHIGQTLEMAYINYLLDQKNKLIYTQVEVDNTASLKLQEKLLLTRSDIANDWYFSYEPEN